LRCSTRGLGKSELLLQRRPLTAETVTAITTEDPLEQLSRPAGDLDPDYHARCVAAHWRTQPILDELDDLLDRFDALTAHLQLNDFDTDAWTPGGREPRGGHDQ
jgi:hypothetical protein